eukprot:2826160-Rhodomonas_salina.1
MVDGFDKKCADFLPFKYLDPSSNILHRKILKLPGKLSKWENFLRWAKDGNLNEKIVKRFSMSFNGVDVGFKSIGKVIKDEFNNVVDCLIEEEIALANDDANKHANSESVLDIRNNYEKRYVSFVQQLMYLLGE